MITTRRLVCLAIALGVAAGISPVAPGPASADCGSPIVMFFSPGADVSGNQVAARTVNPAAVGCTVQDVSGVGVNVFYVPPGAAFAKARHTGVSDTVSGSIHGLGASFDGAWPRTEHAIPGTFFAESPFVAMDPSQTSGLITANAVGATQQYRTIDR